MKLCPKCNQVKLFSEFGLHRSQKSGLRSWCKICRRIGRRQEYENSKEKILECLADRRRQDPDKVKQVERKQYEKHKEARRVRDRERYLRSAHKTAARGAVRDLIMRGLLLPAHNYACTGCGETARDHHHPSYHPDDYLNVLPLCRSCHVKVHHREDMATSVSAVALPIGMVRIAIAGA